MTLKHIHVPRGYDGLHIELPGAIVNIYTNLHDDNGKVTRVSVNADGRNIPYPNEEAWVKLGSTIGPEGAGIMISLCTAEKVYGKRDPDYIKRVELQ